MPIEDLLTRLCEAIEGQNERLDKMMAQGGSTSKPAGKPAAKPTAAKATASKATASKPKSSSKPAAKKGPTVDDIAAHFGAYLKTGDEDERAQAKENVRAIVDYFGAAKATAIPPENFEEALGYLDQFEAGETPEFDGGSEEEEGGEALV